LVVRQALGRRVAKGFREVLEAARPSGGVAARDFHISGVDFMPVVGPAGIELRLIEINSAPAFAHTTPGLDAWELAYVPVVRHVLDGVARADWGRIAYLTNNKCPVNTSGYGLAFAAATGQPAWLVAPEDLAVAERFGGELHVHGRALAGGLRTLGPKPWRLLPPGTAGRFVNGVDIDLRGGRNKIAAQRAFERWNHEHPAAALPLPRARVALNVDELLAARRALGGWVVAKVPDLNAGVGLTFLGPDTAPPRAGYPLLVQEMLRPPALAGDTLPLAGFPVAGRHYAFDVRVIVLLLPGGLRPLTLRLRRAALAFEDTSEPARVEELVKVNNSVPVGRGRFRLDHDRTIMIDEDAWGAAPLRRTDWLRAVELALAATAAVDAYGRFAGEMDL
jgi:hypothetical protein